MKVILLFALFGLSFYQASGHEGDDGVSKEEGGREIGNEGGNKDYPVPPKPDSKEHTCKTAKESPVFMKNAGPFLCEYRTLAEGGEPENFGEKAKSFMHFLGTLGCKHDDVFGKGRSMDDVLTKISDAKDEAVEPIKKILSALSISDNTADSICSLAGRALQSKCMQEALPKAAPEAVQRMKRLYCKWTRNTEEEDDGGNPQAQTNDKEMAGNLAVMLKDTGCPVTNLPRTSRTMEELTESLGDTIKPMARHVMDLTQKLHVGSINICDMVELTESLGDTIKPMAGHVLDPTQYGDLGKGGIVDRILEGIIKDPTKDKKGGIGVGLLSTLLKGK